jgi:aromatic-L-amino-acid decarboxylase
MPYSNDVDVAEIYQLETVLGSIGRALDTFSATQNPDPQASPERWQQPLCQPLPQTGQGIDATVRDICETLIPNGGPVSRPTFTGFITTSPTTVALAANAAAMLAAPQRQTLHAFNYLEELSLQWLVELFGLPGTMKGIYSSGGSVANLIAIGGARQFAFEQQGIDPAAEGLSRSAVLYASAEAHHTNKRAAGVLGIGRNNVRIIETDKHGRIIPDALHELIRKDKAAGVLPIAVVASAGTTNTGTIDPLKAIGAIARQEGVWFHVDGAYGLPGILDERKKPLYEGLELADSVIVDPHKWLGAQVGVSTTFVRDREILYRAFTQEPAEYLEGSLSSPEVQHSLDSMGIPYHNFGVELSSPPRGVVVWSILKEIGAEGLRKRIEMHNDMAAYVAGRARSHPNLELLLEPTLSICCFRYVHPDIQDINEFNRLLFRSLLIQNEHIPSTTVVNGCYAIRPCFVGARTVSRHAEELVDAVLKTGNDLLQARK